VRIDGVKFGTVWQRLLFNLRNTENTKVSPRGMPISEEIGVTVCVTDARENVLVSDTRRPSYRFMVAEWLWIWFGRNDVATIQRYCSHIVKFSDDGLTFDGAYGPRLIEQWDRTINLLRFDADTRQAVIQVYRTPTRETKDVPCTLSMQLLRRNGALHGIVNMRSSDVWLGLPYDFFNFSMLLNIAAAELDVEVGSLVMNLGSSHLYDVNREAATRVLDSNDVETLRSPRLPCAPPPDLETTLVTGAPRAGQTLLPYESVLLAGSWADSLDAMRKLCV
jgi:thymidylate synthase